MYRKSCRKSNFIWRNKQLLYLLPSLIGVLVLWLIPFGIVCVRSVQHAINKQFCGLENYRIILENQAFLLAVKNTIRVSVVCIPVLMACSLFLAVLIQKSRFLNLLKSSLLFPVAVPTATVVLIWRLLFHKNGICNTLLAQIGFEKVGWLTSGTAFFVLVFSYLWKNLGYTIVLWVAGLNSIPESILEAARMDGASERVCFFRVVCPNLRPVFFTITILSFLNSFKVFREAYLVAGAYPDQSMYLLQHLFNNWYTNLDLDKMAAAAVLLAVVLGGVTFALQKVWDCYEE